MNWTLVAQIPLLIIGCWLFTAYLITGFPTLRGKRICLLIAHPDDEAMFFAPSVIALTQQSLGNKLFILCLSSGDADGLGQVRKTELVKSALMLGVTSAEHVVVVEDERFPDSMTKTWDAKEVAKVLAHYFAPKIASTPTNRAPEVLIDVLVTFDAKGVSGHPNHVSLYHGAKAFLGALMQRHKGWECPVKLYTLTSTNVVRKYSSIVDSIITVLTCIWRTKVGKDFPSPLLAVNGARGIRTAQLTMTTAHKSQMRWFRWGWISLSRYMIVNDLVKAKP
ncbi:N-acetylglucosaminyl-phosphatidylinositol de-N-acetylase [Oleoguttula sp. CCFEE 5521]